MKIRFVAAGAALCFAAAPLAVAAQTTGDNSTITVTAEHRGDWTRGNRLEARGLDDLAKANRDLVRRSADAVNARNRSATARSQAENARRTFEQMTASTVFADPREARRWAGRLDRVATDWHEQSDRMDSADRDLERALRRQATAQEEVNAAQAKIDEGRALMAQAERASVLGVRR